MEYTTQMDAARKGIITKEMEAVAKKEYMDIDELVKLVACGKIIIPANKNHKCLEPNGIGSMLRTKINVNLGTSRDCVDLDMELDKVNNAVKILTPMLAAAGCDSKIQLLTAKSLYEKADVTLPIMIEADQQYFDTVHIARQVGIYYQSSGKPADKAVNEIIRRLDIPQSMYTETWESKGKWQGTVRKYAPEVITMVRSWYAENGYPRDIEYVQSDGQKKTYHVIWRESEVA